MRSTEPLNLWTSPSAPPARGRSERACREGPYGGGGSVRAASSIAARIALRTATSTMVVPDRPAPSARTMFSRSMRTSVCDASAVPTPIATISAVTASTIRTSTVTRAVTVSVRPPSTSNSTPPPQLCSTPNSVTLPSASACAPRIRPALAALPGSTRPERPRSCSRSTVASCSRSVTTKRPLRTASVANTSLTPRPSSRSKPSAPSTAPGSRPPTRTPPARTAKSGTARTQRSSRGSGSTANGRSSSAPPAPPASPGASRTASPAAGAHAADSSASAASTAVSTTARAVACAVACAMRASGAWGLMGRTLPRSGPRARRPRNDPAPHEAGPDRRSGGAASSGGRALLLLRLELGLDAFQHRDLLERTLVEHAADVLDLVPDPGDHELLQRVDAPVRLLDLLADPAKTGLGRGDLDDRLGQLAELAGGVQRAGACPDRAERELVGELRRLDLRHLHAEQVLDRDLDLEILVAGQRQALDRGGTVPGVRQEQREVRLLAGVLQRPARLERGLDQIEELADQRVALPLQQVRAAPGQLELVAPLQQVRAGGCDRLGHRPPRLAGVLRRAPELVHLRAVVHVDLLVLEARELALGKLGEGRPGDLERLLDAAVLGALVDEHLLELVGERQVQLVRLGQGVLAGDRDEASQVQAVRVRRLELVGDVLVVGAGLALADAVVHQSRQRRTGVDRREDALVVEVARQVDLALGDVAGQVGDRVRDVVVGHGEDRQLRDRALLALHHAGALVDPREVGVHVAGIAAAAGNLLARAADLAKRLAVVRHVGQDDQHMVVVLVREVLRGRQRHARGEDPLDRGVVRLVQEQHRPRQSAGPLELLREEGQLSLRDAHRGEHHGELALLADHGRLTRDLRGQLVGRQARSGEDRQLLAADQADQRVDRADAGLDELLGLPPRDGVDRRAADRQPLVGDDLGQAVDRLADSVEAASDHLLADAEAGDVLDQADRGRGEVDARGLLEHLEHGVLLADLDDLPAADATRSVLDADDRVVAQVGCVLEEEQRAGDVADLAVLLLEKVLAHIRSLRRHREALVELLDDRIAEQLFDRGARRDGLAGLVVQLEHHLQHAVRLLEGAGGVDRIEAVLLQEVLPQDAADLDHETLGVLQRVGADELHDLLEVRLALQQVHGPVDEVGVVLRDVLPVPLLEAVLEQRVGAVPVDRREVPPARQRRVERPEAAGDPERRLRDRLGEVAAGGADRADDRDGALLAGEGGHPATALVERGQARRQVGRVALLGRHLLEAGADLAQRLGPATRRVRHDRHRVALVAEVLRQGDAGVDRRLAGGDRHVRGVRDQHRALHQRVSGLRILELGELDEHVGHLVPALAATDVHDDLGVAVLRDRLLRDGLAGAEWSRDRRRAAHREREQHVEDAHAGQERRDRVELLLDRAGLSHRPRVRHLELAAVLEHDDGIVDGVLALRHDGFHGPAHAGRNEDLVGERELRNGADHLAGRELVPHLDGRRERPGRVARQRVHRDAALDVGAGLLLDLVERALDAVEDAVQHAGSQLDRQRQAGRLDRLADGETAGVLVDLHERRVAVEADDLADEVFAADAHDVVHARAHHAFGDHGRSGNSRDLALDGHVVFSSTPA